MIPISLAGALAKELIGLLGSVIESPDTYKRIDGLRQIVEKVTGKQIDQAGFLTFLEETTQGAAYTGEWEQINDSTRRLRVEGGYIFDIGRANPIFVRDK